MSILISESLRTVRGIKLATVCNSANPAKEKRALYWSIIPTEQNYGVSYPRRSMYAQEHVVDQFEPRVCI